MKQQVIEVKATENVQRVQASVAQQQSDSSSKLSKATESLERIKEKQALKGARFDVIKELANDLPAETLNDRLEAAGIIVDDLNGDAVLARLKNKMMLRIEVDDKALK